ncbi:baseplate J/gp47 family protein [Microbacterium sp. Root180]|uniref:baseplate J/gp47 family protein n=1 Tax=Microbacterium sp. Root180 TaxID=1736483 RepID=UPI0006F48AAA|nr:baseplate J/gp47 family protein [Microbacterium sp. Root180]KRB37865.1 hypothetical protein ASD93_05935 [Microbacterium sp. Root180]
MIRTQEQVLRAMADAARLAPFADGDTWRDALFTGPADTPSLTRPSDPDRALLGAIADEYTQVDLHVAQAAATRRIGWLREVLGIRPLPALPDRVIAHVDVDPKKAPAILPPGTMLRGGKDATGAERRYRTLDALTAFGAGLAGVRMTTEDGTQPLAAAGALIAAAPPFPLPGAAEAAPHILRIRSSALAFTSGAMTIAVEFEEPAALAQTIAVAQWRYCRADGRMSPAGTGTLTGGSVHIGLTGGCVDPEGGTPWIEMVVPAGSPVPEGFTFSGCRVSVVKREGIIPAAAFVGEGLVDVTKEFKPFGEVPRRGQAFYLRVDEALSKTVQTLTVTVTLLPEDQAELSSSPGYLTPSQYAHHTYRRQFLAVAQTHLFDYTDADYERDFPTRAPRAPEVVWERRINGAWQQFGSTANAFTTITASIGDGLSDPYEVSGQPGHYIRAFLRSGDFGWSNYLQEVAQFATDAAGDGAATMPEFPTAPIASTITLSYTTRSVAADRVEALSGWRRRVFGTGPFQPFRRAVDERGSRGQVAFGLDLGDGGLGSTMSLYLVVDSAAPCGAVDDPDARWEWWGGGVWHPLDVADSTQLLRESGLLRFVAPVDWDTGCTDVDASTGRWIRLVTTVPSRLGILRDVIVDAVVAEFDSRGIESDPTVGEALPAGTIKGLLSPIDGVKKVTNVAAVRGRVAEAPTAYARRASALVRHRDRAIAAWDYEQLALIAFPEIVSARALPHTSPASTFAPGTVGLVVLPDRPADPQPRPSVSLSQRLAEELEPRMPMGAALSVLCPQYEPVTVTADVVLRRGVPALVGIAAVNAALEAVLHPGAARPVRWGRDLYASALIAALEKVPGVDSVEEFALFLGATATGTPVDVVRVDACLGLYCSSGAHRLTCREQL